MDLSLSENEERLKQEAHQFMEKEAFKDKLLELEETETGYTPELWDKIAKTEWLGILIPEQYGGSGGSLEESPGGRKTIFSALGTGGISEVSPAAILRLFSTIFLPNSRASRKSASSG